MARADVLKKIKDDVLLENRIQVYRLHYNYLKTCLKHPDEFSVDKKAYSKWQLDKVKSWSFDRWWKMIGKEIMGKQLIPPRVVKSSSKVKSDSMLIEVSADAPTEYNITKIRELLNRNPYNFDRTNQRNHHVKLEIYLESWNLKKENKLTLKQVRKALIDKRKSLLQSRGNKVAMDRTATENFLKFDPKKTPEKHSDPNAALDQMRNLERQVSRYKLNATRILKNVCRGEFPGKYTS